VSAFTWHEQLAPALDEAREQNRLLLRYFRAPG